MAGANSAPQPAPPHLPAPASPPWLLTRQADAGSRLQGAPALGSGPARTPLLPRVSEDPLSPRQVMTHLLLQHSCRAPPLHAYAQGLRGGLRGSSSSGGGDRSPLGGPPRAASPPLPPCPWVRTNLLQRMSSSGGGGWLGGNPPGLGSACPSYQAASLLVAPPSPAPGGGLLGGLGSGRQGGGSVGRLGACTSSALLLLPHYCINCTMPLERGMSSAAPAACSYCGCAPGPTRPTPFADNRQKEGGAGTEGQAPCLPRPAAVGGAGGCQAAGLESRPVLLAYDERMLLHRELAAPFARQHPERPARLTAIMDKLRECGLLQRCKLIPGREASLAQLEAVHEPELVQEVQAVCAQLASRAAGCLAPPLVEARLLARPPGAAAGGSVISEGHHAESGLALGFCLFNNAAVAARAAQREAGVQRVLIVDWDIHHGNGTQAMFYGDASVLYISIHRWDNGLFFPDKSDWSDCQRCDLYEAHEGVMPGGASQAPEQQQRHVLLPIAQDFAPGLLGEQPPDLPPGPQQQMSSQAKQALVATLQAHAPYWQPAVDELAKVQQLGVRGVGGGGRGVKAPCLEQGAVDQEMGGAEDLMVQAPGTTAAAAAALSAVALGQEAHGASHMGRGTMEGSPRGSLPVWGAERQGWSHGGGAARVMQGPNIRGSIVAAAATGAASSQSWLRQTTLQHSHLATCRWAQQHVQLRGCSAEGSDSSIVHGVGRRCGLWHAVE
ncbi:hypothetical protein V8C86DRAFT_2433666 [Haematococcus lacustris]